AGEIYIAGDGLARGYLNRPELTAESFIKHRSYRTHKTYIFYKTGDLARWLPAGPPAGGASGGVIEFLGRIDHQVKIRGFRIETGEIENSLLTLAKIKNAVVTVKAEKDGNKYLTAYITAEEKPDISTLKNDLANYLPAYMIPTHFVFLEEMPLTANGKIDLKALESYNAEVNAGEEYIEPRNEIEKQIALLWKDVLNLTVNPGVNDNFFELGGNSLTIMRLHGKINSTLNRDIPVLNLFEYPTIALMAEYLTRGEKTGEIESQALNNVEESMAETMRFFEQDEE
ncbi:MAG: non-ribosomal peptide synthetase, partial [Acidobacteria bacterium]|nr:non-ribosomal peptide synthetase [Acidobacteriota bacterium]